MYVENFNLCFDPRISLIFLVVLWRILWSTKMSEMYIVWLFNNLLRSCILNSLSWHNFEHTRLYRAPPPPSFLTIRPIVQIYMVFSDVILEEVSTYPQLGLVLNNHLTWEDHINAAILKSNKKIGLIWRLRNEMPRYITEKICTHYIRPQLEYWSLLYDDSTQELTHRLEQCQKQAAIACTGAYRRTNTDALLKEVGWPKLESRRKYNSLVMMYKISHHMVPSTIVPDRAITTATRKTTPDKKWRDIYSYKIQNWKT